MWINAENIINKISLCVGFTTRPDMMRAIQIIKDEPGIDIVRCKDCKWFGDIGCAIQIVDDSDKPTENDYCSFGEVRNE